MLTYTFPEPTRTVFNVSSRTLEFRMGTIPDRTLVQAREIGGDWYVRLAPRSNRPEIEFIPIGRVSTREEALQLLPLIAAAVLAYANQER